MWDIIFDVFKDSLIDSLKMLPFLFGAYLLIEFLEHKASDKITNTLTNMGPWGPLGGAVLGAVPQCGFSVAAANFFSGRIISVGTLIAVFLSTSDEAIPIIIAHPDKISYLWKMIVVKIIIAVIAGVFVDAVYKMLSHGKKEKPFEEICADCDCEHEGIFLAAFKHTVGIFVFILVINLVLGFAIEFIGEDNISKLFLSGSFFQPFLTALIGFVPNCGASVILTELFMSGTLTFGSVIAGLSTGAGLGLAVLFKTNKHIKQNLAIMAILYGFSVLSGIIINMFIA